MGDPIAWLDAHAGAVQALAALGTLGLTFVLAIATVWYARSAKDQVSELVKARLAIAQPYLHVTWAAVALGEPPSYVNTTVRLGFVNVGPGIALSVRAHAKHPWLKIVPSNDVLNLVSSLGAASDQLIEAAGAPPSGMLAGSAKSDHAHDPGPIPLDIRARLEYRDLADRWWATVVPLRLEFAFEDERYKLQGTIVIDQDEKVSEARAAIGPTDWMHDREPTW